jgi:hypothetical protein
MSIDSKVVEEQALGSTLIEISGGFLKERIDGKFQLKLLQL